MGPDASLDPEAIQAQSFTNAFRGYDTAEVKAFLNRVANEVRAWRERAENLESAWHSAEERAARPPVLDEDTLMAAVGDETAAILRTARAAAADLRTKAAEESGRTLSEAKERAERLGETAKAEAELAVAEARSTAEQLLGDARTQASTMRTEAESALSDARAEADAEAAAILATARAEVTAAVDKARIDAEETRGEADKERRLTIEGAHATRDRILGDLARRRRVATVQIEQLRAGRERLAESYAVVRRTLEEVQSELSRADAEARAAADVVGRRLKDDPDPELTEDHRDRGPSGAEMESDVASAPLAGAGGSAVDELFSRIRSTPRADPEADPAPPEAVEPEAVEPEPVEPEPVEAPADTAVVEVAVVEGEIEEVPERAPAPASPGRSRRRSKRSEPEHPVEEAPAVTAEPAVADDDESLLQRREEAVSDLEVALTRRLKRALQDEQNDVLDRLRNLSGRSGVDRLLANRDEQTARYVDAAKPLLADAASAGADFAAQLLGSTLGNLEVAVDDLTLDCGGSVVGPLRRRLEQAIESAGDDQAVLVEAIGAAYREWKTQRIERLAGDVLCAAFSRGTWQTVPAGGASRWVVYDTEGPCPDCDDNALAGAVPRSEAFPTGQNHPPAHSGCRCLLVPLS